jgi:hypothetical protein
MKNVVNENGSQLNGYSIKCIGDEMAVVEMAGQLSK